MYSADLSMVVCSIACCCRTWWFLIPQAGVTCAMQTAIFAFLLHYHPPSCCFVARSCYCRCCWSAASGRLEVACACSCPDRVMGTTPHRAAAREQHLTTAAAAGLLLLAGWRWHMRAAALTESCAPPCPAAAPEHIVLTPLLLPAASRRLEVACAFSCPDRVLCTAMSGCGSHALIAVGTKKPGVVLADVASGAFTHTLTGHS
jgi:hypothetical protein